MLDLERARPPHAPACPALWLNLCQALQKVGAVLQETACGVACAQLREGGTQLLVAACVVRSALRVGIATCSDLERNAHLLPGQAEVGPQLDASNQLPPERAQ